MKYLVATYDNAYTLTYPPAALRVHEISQWSEFQASRQGPYFTQFFWFHHSPHQQPLSWARIYWAEHVLEIIRSLDRSLKGKKWLIGQKCTWADLAFLPWNMNVEYVMKKSDSGYKWQKDAFPDYQGWQDRMFMMEGVKKAMTELIALSKKSEMEAAKFAASQAKKDTTSEAKKDTTSEAKGNATSEAKENATSEVNEEAASKGEENATNKGKERKMPRARRRKKP